MLVLPQKVIITNRYIYIQSHANKYYLLFIFIDDTFFPKRAAEILWRGNRIGKIGVLHPEVINAFDLPLPCSVMEMNIEPFV